MTPKEDRIAPIDKKELDSVLNGGFEDIVNRRNFLDKLIGILNERQDGYFGLITNISQIAQSENVFIKTELASRLAREITLSPPRYVGRVLSTKIFPKLSTICPVYVASIFEPILMKPNEWFQDHEDQEDILAIQISILKFLRIAEESKGGRITLVPIGIIQDLLRKAIGICDDTTKLDAITLALESRQTTRILTSELDLFRTIFIEALSFQEPSHRQKLLALTSKLINRIKDSLSSAIRYKTLSPERLEEIHSSYKEFLSWLIDICFDNIYYNAYFGSFVLTLSTLKIIAQVINFNDPRFPIAENYKRTICFDTILGCLTDSFEENKQLALELIFILCENNLFDIKPHLSSLREIAYELSGCVNPASSLTAKYIFKMIIHFGPDINPEWSKTDCLFDNLNTLASLTEENIRISKDNFIYGSANHPIYPMLTCIRALLEEIDLVEVHKDMRNWKELISKIIGLLVDACEIVSVLVCNLNPESIGHLPMDIKPVTIDSLSKAFNISVNISDAKYQTITSQMLLISGWKTIKECSLSIGLMCNRLWWMYPNPGPGPGTLVTRAFQSTHEPLIDFDGITKMISFFNHYLKNLRHRGAFEQAYNGFLMLTKRVWPDKRCRKLLVDSLQSIMLDFKGEYNAEDNSEMIEGKVKFLKAYTTRRSAGLPFMIQAILVSENRHESENLRWVVDSLFSILNNKNTEEYQKVHSLNILKALINEHQLAEKVAPYIEQTFIVTIESFGSESFPIRNCANMLLSAVVGRTFGCSRLKNNIHRKNKLSFECFFSRYPRMIEIMLRYLSHGLESRYHLASVHTIIIILNRLHPSINPSINYTHEKVILPFVGPMAEVCFKCPDLNLRKIAAKLTVKLEYFCINYASLDNSLLTEKITTLKNVEDLVVDSGKLKTIKENHIHGSILILKEWLNLQDLRDQPYFNHVIKKISLVTEQMIATMICLLHDHHAFSYRLMCELFNLIETYIVRLLNSEYRQECISWKLDLKENTIFNLDQDDPALEEFAFKHLQIYLMSGLETGKLSSHKIENLFATLLSKQPDRVLSNNFHQALIRWIRFSIPARRSLSELESILENLDIDFLIVHETIFDKSKDNNQSEYDRNLYKNYIHNKLMNIDLHKSERIQKSIFDLINLQEFQPNSVGQMFSAKISNTPRAIELLALMSMLADELNFNLFKWSHDDDGSLNYKLQFMITFVKILPECDTKFVALFCSSKLAEVLVKQEQSAQEFKFLNSRVFVEWSSLLESVADGSNCLLSRRVTAIILKSTLHQFFSLPPLEVCHDTFVNLLSTLFKLMNDDEYSIRLLAMKSLFKLNESRYGGILLGTKTQKFMHLVTRKVFNSNESRDFVLCCNLLIKIIFNHSENIQEVEIDDQERLFDKCKLNTCADYVAIIAGAREALREFITSRSKPIALDTDFDLPASELMGEKWSEKDSESNEAILRKSSELILADLNKLDATGYRRILLDNGYSHYEFSLYRRTAFISLLLDLWPEDIELQHIKSDLRDGFTRAYHFCSTNLFSRCLNFLKEPTST